MVEQSILTEVKKTKTKAETDPTPEKVSATLITLDKKTAGKQQNDTKKQLQRVAMTIKQLHMYAYSDLQWFAITAATYRKRRELTTKTAFKLNIL